MQIFIDRVTGALRKAVANSQPITQINFQRGVDAPVELVFVTENVQGPVAAGSIISLVAKPKGKFDADALINHSDFPLVGSGDTARYIGNPPTNTAAINTALRIDSDVDNDLPYIDLIAQVRWQDGPGGPISKTEVFNLRISNDVARGDESTPLELPSPEDWLAARAMPLPLILDHVPNTVGRITLTKNNPAESALTLPGIGAGTIVFPGLTYAGIPARAAAIAAAITDDLSPYSATSSGNVITIVSPRGEEPFSYYGSNFGGGSAGSPLVGNFAYEDIATAIGQLAEVTIDGVVTWYKWTGASWQLEGGSDDASDLTQGTLDPDRIADASLNLAKTNGLPAALDSKAAAIRNTLTSIPTPTNNVVDDTWFGCDVTLDTLLPLSLGSYTSRVGKSFRLRVSELTPGSYRYVTVAGSGSLRDGLGVDVPSISSMDGWCLIEATPTGWRFTAAQVQPASLYDAAALADGHSFVISQPSAAGWGQRKALLSALWTYVSSKLMALTTITGPKTFTGDITAVGNIGLTALPYDNSAGNPTVGVIYLDGVKFIDGRSFCVFLGKEAGPASDAGNGKARSIGIGYRSNPNGAADLVSIGDRFGENVTSGANAVLIASTMGGAGTLTTATGAIVLGKAAGVTSLLNSVYIGEGGSYVNGTECVAIGKNSGAKASTGGVQSRSSEISIGSFAGYTTAASTGKVVIGHYAGYNGSGAYQVCLGFEAGRRASVAAGDAHCVYIGYRAGSSGTGGPQDAGNYTKSVAIGYRAYVAASNVIALGGVAADAVSVGIGTASPSETLDVVGNVKATGFKSADGSLGASGTFTSADSKTVTVKNGLITSIS